MNQDERRFDFHGLCLALKQAREEKGWTQAYVAELVGKTDRTIMNIENKGQHPSFNLFFKLVTLFDISVDQFFYTEGNRGGNSCRKHIDVLLDSMNEKSLLSWRLQPKGSRKPEKRRFKSKSLCFFAPFSGVSLNGYTETSIIPKSPWKADKAWLLAEIFGITFYWILYSRKQKMPPRHRNSV